MTCGPQHPASLALMRLTELVRWQESEERHRIHVRRMEIRQALRRKEYERFFAELEFKMRDPVFRWRHEAICFTWRRHPDYILIEIERLETEWVEHIDRMDLLPSHAVIRNYGCIPARCRIKINTLWAIYDQYYGIGTVRVLKGVPA